MGKKDLAGKDFFADRKRFAELFNSILYEGEEVIHAEELEVVHRSYPLFSGKGEANRDIFMRDAGRNICYGLELETESDYSMPERVMVYDACELEWQIKEIRKGHNAEQSEGEKLHYREKKSRIKEADFINAEKFETDLKEFFQVMQCRKDKRKLREILRTERFCQLKEDAAWAIAVHLDRKRLVAKIKKEKSGMCIALDELLEDERIKERTSIVRKMVAEGIDQEIICKVAGCSLKELETRIGK